MSNDKIFSRLYSDYQLVQSMGYEVVGVFLQGSQNYGLSYEGSDVDTKVIVLPKFNDFLLNKKPTSFTHVLPSNEHVDIKDIRLMLTCYEKQNINFVETLFTKYYVINEDYEEFMRLMNKEVIARYNNIAALNCMVGMAYEKQKALKHPYPATAHKIEKFGYDCKQLHHVIRLNEFIKRYVAGEPYSNCLISKMPEYLIDIKANSSLSVHEAESLVDKLCKEMSAIKEATIARDGVIVNKEVEVLMQDVLLKIMTSHFRRELGVDV